MKLSFALFITLVLSPALAVAQVKVNQAALLQLAGISMPAPVMNRPEPTASLRRVVHRHRIIHHHGVTIAVAKPVPVPVPVVARVSPPLPPVVKHVPLAPLEFKFPVGSAALPASAATALKPFCVSKTPVGINARAPGDPSDPSIAMRLSLSRARAVRDALVACGVAPADVIPRALGSVPGQDENEAVVGALAK